MKEEEMMKIKGKLNFYMDQQIKVHIKRTDGYFWNGFIVSKPADDVYEFEEDKFGNSHLFVADVFHVEKCKGWGE